MNNPEVSVSFTAEDEGLSEALESSTEEMEAFADAQNSAFADEQLAMMKEEADALAEELADATDETEGLGDQLKETQEDVKSIARSSKGMFNFRILRMGFSVLRRALRSSIQLGEKLNEEIGKTPERAKFDRIAESWRNMWAHAVRDSMNELAKFANWLTETFGGEEAIGAGSGGRQRDAAQFAARRRAETEALERGLALVSDVRTEYEKIRASQRAINQLTKNNVLTEENRAKLAETAIDLEMRAREMINEQFRMRDAERFAPFRATTEAIRSMIAEARPEVEKIEESLNQMKEAAEELSILEGEGLTQAELERGKELLTKPLRDAVEQADKELDRIQERMGDVLDKQEDLQEKRAALLDPDFSAQFVGLTELSRRIQQSAASRQRDTTQRQIEAIDKQTQKLNENARELQEEHQRWMEERDRAGAGLARLG